MLDTHLDLLSSDKYTDIPSKCFVRLHKIFKTSSRHVFKTSKCLLGNIFIQKPDKVNSVVIVDKIGYLDKTENLLSDTRKFERINLKNDGILSFAVNQEKWVDNILKKACCV